MMPARDSNGVVDAVVIGGSAGALDVLAVLLPALPPVCDVPFVIVLHIPATRPNRLAEVLTAWSPLPVREIEDKEPVARGTVYVAPPGYHALVEREGTFALSADELLHFSRPAVDVLFESAAGAYGARLVGIVLTGANEDGARGLRAIERAGGLCVVQRPDTAVARGMPEAAIAMTVTPRVLPPAEIAVWLGTLSGSKGEEAS
jgi:two-component system chemotaxis response regulator CheB